MTSPDTYNRVTPGRILGLALPALGVLTAVPLYLLLDTAVIGRLGATDLAALAAGATILAVVTTDLTFLAYGTTARASRAFGRGDMPGVVREGVQATWVAIGVGSILFLLIQLFGHVLTRWIAPADGVGAAAASWLQVAGLGIPLALISQAGNGWMRGLQDTRRPLLFVLAGVIPSALTVVPLVLMFGLVGSAWSNVLGQSITALFFLFVLAREAKRRDVSLRPDFPLIKAQLVLGRDLILRSAAFQIAFLSAAAVAGRMGAPSLAGHQVQLQLWSFLTLVLDSLAIAAQILVGAALGAGSAATARYAGRKVILWSMIFSLVLAAVFAAGHSLIPRMFTNDQSVLEVLGAGPWWLLVLLIPIGGVVFAIDGVLLGAGDAAFLRNATILSVITGFLPPVWMSYAFDWGLTGIWWGLVLMLVVRCAAVVLRYRGDAWIK